MAASAGSDDTKELSNSEVATESPNSADTLCPQIVHQNSDDVSSNGSVSCSSFSGANKTSSVLRPSMFSATSSLSSSSSGSGSNVSSSNFGINIQKLENSSHKNLFSLRASGLDTVSNSDVIFGSRSGDRLLRPSRLESPTSTTNSSFVLSPAKLNNPFFKVTDKEDSSSSCITSTTPIQNTASPTDTTDKQESQKVSFVPLASSASSSGAPAPASSSNTSSVPSFVFGQNLHERVEVSTEVVRAEAESSTTSGPGDPSSSSGESSKTNGVTPEMLFTSVMQRELPDKQSDLGSDEKKRKSLSEAAREYEESRAVKRKYEEVTVKTGEEEEINVLQINCKLFAFNKEKSTYVERGRGTLRVNDLSTENKTQSRVVMRTSGSFRVVLNTKIWAEMVVDRPSEKSVRITAMDASGEIKVFLVMAGVKEVDQLFKALEWRVKNQKKLVSTGTNNSEPSGS